MHVGGLHQCLYLYTEMREARRKVERERDGEIRGDQVAEIAIVLVW